jgi:hypothetical protein
MVVRVGIGQCGLVTWEARFEIKLTGTAVRGQVHAGRVVTKAK